MLLALPLAAALSCSAIAANSPVSAPAPALAASPQRIEQWVVLRRASAAQARARADFLAELAQLRRARASSSFADRLARGRADMLAQQAELRAAALAEGAELGEPLWLIDALVLRAPSAELLAALRARPDVLDAQPSLARAPQLAIATDANHHDAVGAHALSVGGLPIEGQGQAIAIIDTGVDIDHALMGRPHAAFYPGGDPATATGAGLQGSRVLSAVDLAYWEAGDIPDDSWGHGTRMASIAAGAKFNNFADVADGVAPKAALRSYKIAEDSHPYGWAQTVTMVTAFQAAVSAPDVRVANMSFDGHNDPAYFLNTAIDATVEAGVFVTLSAGNHGADMSVAHACYNALVVGASQESSYSAVMYPFQTAIGPLPDGRRYPAMIAMGQNVTCAMMDNEGSAMDSNGSSAGAALSAGAAALVFQANPNLTPIEVRALLLNTLAPAAGSVASAEGYGYLKIKDAVAAALAGNVLSEFCAPDSVHDFALSVAAGQSIALTLVWPRTGTLTSSYPSISAQDDLDLELLDAASGGLIASSASSVDPVEQLRWVAPAAANLVARVRVHASSSSSNTLVHRFTLAGVSAHSVDGGGCAYGPPAISAVVPSVVPSIAPGANTVILQGCNLFNVSSVKLNGVLATNLKVIGGNEVRFDIPVQTVLGPLPLVLQTASGPLNSTLTIGPPATPVMKFAGSSSLLLPNVNYSAWLAGQPGAIAFQIAALDLLPSSLPGLVDLAIGNGFSSYLLLGSKVLGSNGLASQPLKFTQSLGGLPVHFQSAQFDPATGLLPLAASNVMSVTVL